MTVYALWSKKDNIDGGSSTKENVDNRDGIWVGCSYSWYICKISLGSPNWWVQENLLNNKVEGIWIQGWFQPEVERK